MQLSTWCFTKTANRNLAPSSLLTCDMISEVEYRMTWTKNLNFRSVILSTLDEVFMLRLLRLYLDYF
jgi:hypothetical protein